MKAITGILTPLITCAVLLMSSCHKPKDEGQSTLTLHFHTNFGSSEVAEGKYYAASGLPNHNIQFNKAQYYLSNIMLTKTDGSMVSVSGVELIQWGTEEYYVGKIPVGTYKSIMFNVGLDATSNHSDPSTHNANTDPLNSNNGMNFANTTQGYIFLAWEGIDSVAGGNKTPFSFHLGSDAELKSVTMPDHSGAPWNVVYNATTTSGITVHITGDYATLLGNVNPATTSTVDPFTNNTSTATTLSNNISSMFTYEE